MLKLKLSDFIDCDCFEKTEIHCPDSTWSREPWSKSCYFCGRLEKPLSFAQLKSAENGVLIDFEELNVSKSMRTIIWELDCYGGQEYMLMLRFFGSGSV